MCHSAATGFQTGRAAQPVPHCLFSADAPVMVLLKHCFTVARRMRLQNGGTMAAHVSSGFRLMPHCVLSFIVHLSPIRFPLHSHSPRPVLSPFLSLSGRRRLLYQARLHLPYGCPRSIGAFHRSRPYLLPHALQGPGTHSPGIHRSHAGRGQGWRGAVAQRSNQTGGDAGSGHSAGCGGLQLRYRRVWQVRG